jgi:hypothetical protein
LDTIQTPPELTSDFLYLRFIGDRSIVEKDFGRIQKDRHKELDCGQTLFIESRAKQSMQSWQLTIIMLALVLPLQTHLERWSA